MKWDFIQDGYFNDVVLAPSKVAFTKGAHLTSSETKTSKVFTTLRIWNMKSFKSPRRQRRKEMYAMHLKLPMQLP
jgi:hypothetical protein